MPVNVSSPKTVQRFYWLFGLFAVLGVCIILKLLYIQVWDAENLRKRAQQSRNQSLVLYNRGRILDRNGLVLAEDTVRYDIYAHPKYYWKLTPQQLAGALSPILQVPKEALAKKLSIPEFTINLLKNADRAIIDKILQARIVIPQTDHKTKKPILGENGELLTLEVPVKGLDFFKKTIRNYPQGSLASHVLGYVNDEADISTGVEESAKALLRTQTGDASPILLDGRGTFLNVDQVTPETIISMPKTQDVTLTLDAQLQYIAERELKEGIERTKAKKGTVIMMEPATGEILAFAVYPNYRPEQFYKYPQETLKNWAMTDVYPPGSTFKILTLACGLETGVIDKNTRILDTGAMTIGGWRIQNYDYGKHGAPGMIDLIYLLQHSSNIASAKISMMIPKESYYELLRRFGIGRKTGVDIPGESQGILSHYRYWDQSAQASIGYGYSFASTPMQMAAAVNAIANKGVWVAPHVIKNNEEDKGTLHRRVLSEQTAETLTGLLQESIDRNKTATVHIDGIPIAGKTGTSRKPSSNGRGYSGDLYTSFIGYYPAKNPKVLTMVVIDSPKIGEAWGNTVAGPIFRAITQDTISYLGLKPDTITQKPAQSPAVSVATSQAALPFPPLSSAKPNRIPSHDRPFNTPKPHTSKPRPATAVVTTP